MSGEPGVSRPGLAVPVKALAEAVLERAVRLGLTWRLLPATVTSVAGDGTIQVLHDGDTVPVRVRSMVGPVRLRARVMVLKTPPAGNHIVGWVDSPAQGGGPDGLAWSESDSPAVTAATVVLSVPMTLRARTAYRVELGGGISSSAVGVLADFRLRNGTQPLGEFYRYRTEGGSGGQAIHSDGARYIRRHADTDLAVRIDLTLQTTSGTVIHIGAPTRPRYLQITACGSSDAFPHAPAVT